MTIRPTCGFRAGVEAHEEAGEPLCPDCRRSARRRYGIRLRNQAAIKRRQRDDDDGDYDTLLEDFNAHDTLVEHFHSDY